MTLAGGKSPQERSVVMKLSAKDVAHSDCDTANCRLEPSMGEV